MGITVHAGSQCGVHGGAQADLKEIVMGLHWDPPEDGVSAAPADLDAVCVLFNAQGGVLDVIHPGHPRSANGSVVHTGDSRTGASEWDDERIFVFLEALPDAVSALTFVVIITEGRGFSEVRGASCHVSDYATERECVRLDLTTLDARMVHCVATFYRGPTYWRMSMDAHATHGSFLADLLLLVASGKRR